MKKTSIVILTYNQLKYTKMCINNIRLFTKPNYEIIVVDNASTDGTVEWLKEQSDITAIFNDVNKGFPAGCNQGILKAGGDTIVLLNNDTIVTPRWLDNLLICLNSSEKIGAAGPTTNSASYYQHIPVHYTNYEELIVFADKFNLSSPALWKERLKLTGFCLALKREVINKIGLLDEKFSPGYAEDDDYCFRVIQAGYKIIFCADTFIHHYGNISFDEFTKDMKHNDYLQKFGNSYQIFENKWGFSSIYHAGIRLDVINMINKADCLRNIRVLEIGCACGGTLLEIKHGFPHAELFGVEINQDAARIAGNFAAVQVCDIEKSDIGYPHNFFDYILLPDVLEHLADPWELLKKLKRYLKPNGQIIASIPNVMHFSVISSLLNGKWDYAEMGILDKTHLRFFTLATMKDMFEKCGYLISEIQKNDCSDNIDANTQKFLDYLAALVPPQIKNGLPVIQYFIRAQRKF